MMEEISLHILDIVNNSIKAKSTLIEISISIDVLLDNMIVIIKDNGIGMSTTTLEQVIDPFYTTRTTRKVGLGIPFFKLSAESTGGNFLIKSWENEGTYIEASYVLSHIDRLPLGDISSTIQTLITFNESIDFLYSYSIANNNFTLNTRELKETLGGISFNNLEVYNFIKSYLQENHDEINTNCPFTI